MIDYSTYKVLHILAAFTVFLGLGAALIPASGARGPKWVAPVHGIGLFLSLLGGFGLLARLGITSQWPAWVVGKLVIWTLLGGWLAVAKRRLLPVPASVALLVFLGGMAAYLAIYKPGS